MFEKSCQVSFRQVCLVDDERLNGRGIDRRTKFFGVVCQNNVQHVLDFLFFKRGNEHSSFLYEMHTEDDMPDHTSLGGKPYTNLSLKLL